MICINVMTKNILLALKQRRFRDKHAEDPVSRKEKLRRVECNRAYRKRYPGKYETVNRINNLKRNGWTPTLVEEAKEKQNNLCAICGTSFSEIEPHADHEHTEPPKPRSLLCGLCNKGLGQFLDKPERLEAAAAYLRSWGK